MNNNEPCPAVHFWEQINNDWVKIRIERGQSLRWGFGYQTDEGYHSEVYDWHFDGFTLMERFDSRSCDCDGPLDRWAERACEVEELHHMPNRDADHYQRHKGRNGSIFCYCPFCTHYRINLRAPWKDTDPMLEHNALILTPNWNDEDRGQRDHYAEQMGY